MKKILLYVIGGFVILGILSAIFGDSEPREEKEEKEIVYKGPYNSAADGSVWEIKLFMKGEGSVLNDPKSYEPVGWGRVTANSDSSLFTVQHTYRANNSFGALVKETKTFTIARTGRVVGVE